MNRARRIAAAWSELATDQLAEQVRLMVKARDANARAVWTAVAEDQVLAARVRGALSGLKAEFRGHRDEVMWLLWINQAQAHLATPPPASPPASADTAPAAEPVEEPVAEPVLAELTVHEPVIETPRAARDIPVMVFQEPLSG